MLNSLFSKSKQKILGLVFLHPDRQFYLHELKRLTGISQGTLHRELKPLVNDGILKSEKRGNQVFYYVNRDNPIYAELQRIVVKTFGVADILKEALKPLKKKIRIAFIYGSIASGTDTAQSDIDLMVVGKLTFADVSKALDKAEQSLDREISPTIYPIKEFQDKAKSDNHFINMVLNSELNFIVGNKDDLRKLVGKQVAQET